jgi:mono/diheme cytochrome c family protein
MIRAAFLALVITAAPAVAQTAGTKKPGTTSTKAPATKSPPTKTAPPGKTTLSGVYTLEEAEAGKELFLGTCTNCHPIVTHATGAFRRKWQGKPLSELFTYMKTEMPKNDPGSLADEDYAIALAYLLQANRMPAGKTYLSTDTLELRKIRIDTVRSVRKP